MPAAPPVITATLSASRIAPTSLTGCRARHASCWHERVAMGIRPTILAAGIVLAASLATSVLAALEPAADLEREIARRVNLIRREGRVPPLKIDPALSKVAREYSCALARRGALSHADPAGVSVADRVRKAGKTFGVVGENLASSTNVPDPAVTAVQSWMESPGHRKNILQPEFAETGVGVCRASATYYFTQVFAGPGRR